MPLQLEGKILKKQCVNVSFPPEQQTERQKVNFYFEIHDLDGYTLKGFLQNIKAENPYISDFGKMVFAGERKWQDWTAKATEFFTESEVKNFILQDVT